MEFRVDAAWYETPWIRFSCAAAVLALVWGLFRLRIAQLSRHLRARARTSSRSSGKPTGDQHRLGSLDA